MSRHKTAQFIEEQKSAISTEASGKKRGIGRGRHPNSRKGNANLKPWPKGISGNPGGLPGTDLSALYARRFFEAHPEGISREMARELQGFNAYGFSVLADRGYGKVKDKQTVEHVGSDGKPLCITVRFVTPKLDSRSPMMPEPTRAMSRTAAVTSRTAVCAHTQNEKKLSATS